jgi:ribosomal 50S subunit-recycling heat shock protein
MRIDVFLKLSGLLKTRSVAGKACSGGFVLLNGATARPSAGVSPGDVIELTRPDGTMVRALVRAIPVSRQVSRKERGSLVEIQQTEGDRGESSC